MSQGDLEKHCDTLEQHAVIADNHGAHERGRELRATIAFLRSGGDASCDNPTPSNPLDLSTWDYLKLKRDHATLSRLQREDEVLGNKLTHRRYIAAWNIANGRLMAKRKEQITAIEAEMKRRGIYSGK